MLNHEIEVMLLGLGTVFPGGRRTDTMPNIVSRDEMPTDNSACLNNLH